MLRARRPGFDSRKVQEFFSSPPRPPRLLSNSYRSLAPGCKAAGRRTSRHTTSVVRKIPREMSRLIILTKWHRRWSINYKIFFMTIYRHQGVELGKGGVERAVWCACDGVQGGVAGWQGKRKSSTRVLHRLTARWETCFLATRPCV
jgi:hypothetical protein